MSEPRQQVPDWLYWSSSDAHYGRRIPGLHFTLDVKPDASLIIRFADGSERPAELTEMAMWHKICELLDSGDGIWLPPTP